MEKQTKLNAGAVKNGDCMDVDLAQTEEEIGKENKQRNEKEKKRKSLNTFSQE